MPPRATRSRQGWFRSPAAPEIHWDLYRVNYEFRDQSGKTFTGSTPQFSYRANELLAEGVVDVTYAIADPSVSKMDFSFSVLSVLQFFGAQFLFIVVGIWGSPRMREAITERREPIEVRAVPPVVTNGRRSSWRRAVS